MKLTNLRAYALFVIILTLGAFNSAEARQVYNPNEPIVSHTFSVQKLPRSTTPAQMHENFIRKSVAEGGWDNTRFYNYVGNGRAKIMIFPPDAYLWCDRQTGIPVYRDICFNPVEMIPQEQAAEAPAQRYSIGQYVQEALDYFGGNIGQCQQYLDYAQRCYPSCYPQMCQRLQQCQPTVYKNVQITKITNTNINTNVNINKTVNNTPPVVCLTSTPQVGTVAPPNNTQIPFASPSDSQSGTVAGRNRAASTSAGRANIASTTAGANQSAGKIKYLNGHQVMQAGVAPATIAGTAKIAKQTAVPAVVSNNAPVTRAGKNNAAAPHVAPSVPRPSNLISYRGGAGNGASATHANALQSAVPRSSSASVPRVSTFAGSARSASVPRVNYIPRANTYRAPSAPSFKASSYHPAPVTHASPVNFARGSSGGGIRYYGGGGGKH